MTTSAPASASPSKWSGILWPLVALALLARVPSVAEPLGIDQSLWASAVRGMARGQLLYRDVWEQRPPGIYFTYLAGFQVFGWRVATVAWLDILAAGATTVLIYATARVLAGRMTAALSAALFSALTIPCWLFGYGGFLERSICETFITVCVAAAAWAAATVHVSRLSAAFPWMLSCVIGLASGAAVVYKPNAGLYFPAILVWLWLYGERRLRTFLIAMAASALVPVLTVAWLWRLDLLTDARVAVIDFNRFYVAGGFTLMAFADAFAHAVFLRIKTDPLWLGGSVAACVAVADLMRTRRLAPLPGLAVAWGAAGAGVIVVNGIRLFNSYFLQVGAPLALLLAWWLTDGARGPLARRLAAVLTVLLMVLIMAQRGYVRRVVEWTMTDWAAMTGRIDPTANLERFGGYGNGRGYSARANQEAADYVRARTGPDDQIFVFGINGAGLPFLSDRLTAHRFLRVNFFVPTEFPNPDFQLSAVLRDLTARRPRYVIFEVLHGQSEMARAADALPEEPAVRAFLEPYAFEAQIEDFRLYRLR